MESPDSPPPSIPSSSLEIRLFYVRLSPCAATSAPAVLTLDINGAGGRRLPLRRDRLDPAAGEATYVSTDSVRLAAAAADFEVSDDRSNLLLCGTLERVEAPWINGTTGWTMACYSAAGSGFSQSKMGMEVYMAGSFAGSPVILTQTVQLSPRKKPGRHGMLDSIPEDDEVSGKKKEIDKEGLIQRKDPISVTTSEGEDTEYDLSDIKTGQSPTYYPENWYTDEDGQLSWFNAGVRVGVGIGLGMCVGIGIGVGILVRSYQSTTRTFRRRFL